MSETVRPLPLQLRGCAFTALSTGETARTLQELHERILRVPGRSLYYHFWGRLLRPVLKTHAYVNDLGNWVGHELRDVTLAERLALVDPADKTDIETLRNRVAELLSTRLSEEPYPPRTGPDEAFHFLEGQMVIFDTGRTARDPGELARILPELSSSTVYYHLIDARHRPPTGVDDFQRWLEGWGDLHQPLIEALQAVDVYFTPLARLQEELTHLFAQHTAEVRA